MRKRRKPVGEGSMAHCVGAALPPLKSITSVLGSMRRFLPEATLHKCTLRCAGSMPGATSTGSVEERQGKQQQMVSDQARGGEGLVRHLVKLEPITTHSVAKGDCRAGSRPLQLRQSEEALDRLPSHQP